MITSNFKDAVKTLHPFRLVCPDGEIRHLRAHARVGGEASEGAARLTGVSYDKLLQSWFGNGYAGALGWAYTDAMFNSGDYGPVKAFADAHTCETRY